jgi:hypothetical protein
MNRKSSMISIPAPFALSPSTSLRTGLSKGERRVFKHSPMGEGCASMAWV